MSINLECVIADLMPNGAILYTYERFPYWEIVGVMDTDTNELLSNENAFVIIWLVNGTVFYVPLSAPGYFPAPTENVERIEAHIISDEILKPYQIQAEKEERSDKFKTNGFIGIFLLFIFALFAIPYYQALKSQQLITDFNNATRIEIRQEQEIKMQQQQYIRRLQTRISNLSDEISEVYVLTNAPSTLKGKLLPVHRGLGSSNISEAYREEIYNNNPEKDFLENEDKYSYAVMVRLEGDKVLFHQSSYSPSSPEVKKSNLEDNIIALTVSRKATEKEIDDMLKNGFYFKTRADIEHYIPSMHDGYFRKRYLISMKELKTGNLSLSNQKIKDLNFDNDKHVYFISAINANLSKEEQYELVNKFTTLFSTEKNAFADCCSWQQISLNSNN